MTSHEPYKAVYNPKYNFKNCIENVPTSCFIKDSLNDWDRPNYSITNYLISLQTFFGSYEELAKENIVDIFSSSAKIKNISPSLEQKIFKNIIQNTTDVYMEIHSCKAGYCADFSDMLEVWAKENETSFKIVHTELYSLESYHTKSFKKICYLLKSKKPIYKELLSMYGSMVDEFGLVGWIDVMPYLKERYHGALLSTGKYFSYKKIKQSNSSISPKTISYYEVDYTEEGHKASCTHKKLNSALDICSSIAESKKFYTYFVKTPYFQKHIMAQGEPLYEILAKKDHRKYFYLSDIYCE